MLGIVWKGMLLGYGNMRALACAGMEVVGKAPREYEILCKKDRRRHVINRTK